MSTQQPRHKSRRIKILQRARSWTSMMTLRRSAPEIVLASPGYRLSIHAHACSYKTCGLQVQENCRAQEQRAVGLLRLLMAACICVSSVRSKPYISLSSASRRRGCGQSNAKRRLLCCMSKTPRVWRTLPMAGEKAKEGRGKLCAVPFTSHDLHFRHDTQAQRAYEEAKKQPPPGAGTATIACRL